MNNYILAPDGELKHYGVIGMKWGVRRARKKGTSYAYKSHATKTYEKKANKARKRGNTEKANKYDTYAKRSAGLDKKMQDYNTNLSVGKTIAQSLLVNSRNYSVAKLASGNKGWISRGVGYVSSNYSLGLGDIITRAAYVRTKE